MSCFTPLLVMSCFTPLLVMSCFYTFTCYELFSHLNLLWVVLHLYLLWVVLHLYLLWVVFTPLLVMSCFTPLLVMSCFYTFTCYELFSHLNLLWVVLHLYLLWVVAHSDDWSVIEPGFSLYVYIGCVVCHVVWSDILLKVVKARRKIHYKDECLSYIWRSNNLLDVNALSTFRGCWPWICGLVSALQLNLSFWPFWQVLLLTRIFAQ